MMTGKVRPYTNASFFLDNLRTVSVRYFAVNVNRTLTSLYDENKPCVSVSYLRPKFTKSAMNVSLILANVNNKND